MRFSSNNISRPHGRYATPSESPLTGGQLISKQAGVTLIEALISILVFSVGALGLAALQLTAISASGDSQQRSVAIWKAQELADRMRSNPNLIANYIARINSEDIAIIGVDTPSTTITCDSGIYATPGAFCADNKDGPADNCTDQEKVNFDVWDVFCEPNTGAAVAGAGSVDGSAALTNLDIVLRQNDLVVDGNDDIELYLEWFSRESDSDERIANTGSVTNIQTDLCGRANINVDSRLDVYCLRFRP